MELNFFRHLEDVSDHRTPYRDNELQGTDLHVVPEMVTIIVDQLRMGNYNQIDLVHTNKRRSFQTQKLIVDEMKRRPEFDGIKLNILIDNRLEDMYHGEYLVDPCSADDSGLPVSESNDIFLLETFTHNNIFYRRGDPVLQNNGEYKYPSLVGKFSKFGESQIEASIRLYSFLKDFISQYHIGDNQSTLPILLGHSLVMIRSYEISTIMKQVKGGLLENLGLGNLIFEEWKQPISDVIKKVSSKPYHLSVDFTEAVQTVELLQNELNYLRQLYSLYGAKLTNI